MYVCGALPSDKTRTVCCFLHSLSHYALCKATCFSQQLQNYYFATEYKILCRIPLCAVNLIWARLLKMSTTNVHGIQYATMVARSNTGGTCCTFMKHHLCFCHLALCFWSAKWRNGKQSHLGNKDAKQEVRSMAWRTLTKTQLILLPALPKNYSPPMDVYNWQPHQMQ